MSDWKTIKAPRALFLPVLLGGAGEKKGFENTGMKVFPHDEIRVMPGSNRIEINGVEHRMLISTDVLRTDAEGYIHLDKPKPPSRIFSGGEGRASVGKMGHAVASARQNSFTPEGRAPRRQGATHARGMPIISDETPAYGRPVQQDDVLITDPAWDRTLQSALGKPEGKSFSDKEMAEAFEDPNIEVREITLKYGDKAFARFDKRTGKQVGTPFRQYQATYDEEGRQVGAPTRSHGPNFDHAKYEQMLAKQNAGSEAAPTGHDPYPQARPKNASRTLHGPPPVQVEAVPRDMSERFVEPPSPSRYIGKMVSTGSPHLDSFITTSPDGSGGLPIGKLTWLQGPKDVRDAFLDAAGATRTASFASALGDMALVKGAPVVALELEDLTSTEVRLALADDLPTLIEQVQGIDKAAFIISTPVPEKDSKLMAYMSFLCLIVARDAEDERFFRATVVKSEVQDKQQGKSISYPAPG